MARGRRPRERPAPEGLGHGRGAKLGTLRGPSGHVVDLLDLGGPSAGTADWHHPETLSHVRLRLHPLGSAVGDPVRARKGGRAVDLGMMYRNDGS